MLNEIVALLGKSIADEDVKAFAETLAIVYPKSLNVTPNSDRHSLQNKKAGLGMSFELDCRSPLYLPIRSNRKNSYLPRFSTFSITKNFSGPLPLGLRMGMSEIEIAAIMGEEGKIYAPFEDDISDPQERTWRKTMDVAKEITLNLFWRKGSGLSTVELKLNRQRRVFFLYDYWDEREIIFKRPGKILNVGLFMEWAIRQDFVGVSPAIAQSIAAVKRGEMNGVQWIQQQIDSNQIWESMFCADENFVWKYANNQLGFALSTSGTYLRQDFETALVSEADRAGRRLAEIESFIEAIPYTQENYEKVAVFFELRLKQFRDGVFNDQD